MKDELTTILDAMRAAQAELADYLVSADRNAELTIARLVGILDRREVVRAIRLPRALERPGSAPQRTLAEASGCGSPARDPARDIAKSTSYSAMRHEEPRLEATLAGFDIRSPRVGPSAGVTPTNVPPKSCAVCALRDSRRVKIS